MRITLLANRDLASNVALNLLLPELVGGHQLRVFLSSQVGASNTLPEDLAQLRFCEQTLFNEILFPALQGNLKHGCYDSFDNLGSLTDEVPATLNGINSPPGLAQLAATQPDLVISIRYGGILKAEAISIPRYGVFNLHSGRLPDYRGVMATFWAMLNGDREIGTTLHYISDERIDTGAIIGTTHQPLQPQRSYLWNLLSLYPPACKLIVATVNKLARGEPPRQRAQAPGGAYYSFPGTSELSRFKAAGNQLFNFDEISEITRSYLGSVL